MDPNAPPFQTTRTTGNPAARPPDPTRPERTPTSATTSKYVGNKTALNTGVFGFNNNTQSELCTTHDNDAVVNWTSRDAIRGIGPTKLKMLGPEAIVYQHRQSGPSLLEAPDNRINFCAPDASRVEFGGHVIKVFANRASLDAMASTLLNLAALHNAPFLHIRVDPEPAQVGAHHRQQFSEMSNDAMATEPTPTSAEESQIIICAHCHRHGHTSGDCAMPNLRYGNIKPCPVCNDNLNPHEFDRCPSHPSQRCCDDQDFFHCLAEILLVKRYNKPQVQSAWKFYDVLNMASSRFVENLDVCVPGWPWSNEFAYKVGHAKPGDEILQGKLHPSQFDHALHSPGDLPEDPLFRGKTIRQVLEMVDEKEGQLYADRVIPADKMDWAREPLTEEETDRVIRAAMVDETAIKQEDPGIVTSDVNHGIVHWKKPAAQKAIREQVRAFFKGPAKDPEGGNPIYQRIRRMQKDIAQTTNNTIPDASS